MNALTENDLLRIKKRIEQAKQEAAEWRGVKRQLMTELKTTYNCSTIEQGQALVNRLEKEIQQTQKRLAVALQELEQMYDVGDLL